MVEGLVLEGLVVEVLVLEGLVLEGLVLRVLELELRVLLLVLVVVMGLILWVCERPCRQCSLRGVELHGVRMQLELAQLCEMLVKAWRVCSFSLRAW